MSTANQLQPDASLPRDLALDSGGRLLDEIPCRVCGYNLRGSDPQGACAECGTAVGWSVVGDLLRYSVPEWMRRLARGINFFVAGIVVMILLSVGGIVAGMLQAAGPGSATAVATLALVGGLLANALMIIGIWLLTTPEAAKVEQETALNARKLARYGMAFGFLVSFVASGSAQVGASPLIAYTVFVLNLAGAIIAIVGYFALFVYLRKLALRIPNDALARQTRIVMWGIVIGYALIFVAALFGAAASTTGGGAVPAAVVGVCGAGILLVIFGIWGLLLIDRYRRHLNEAARIAQATWASRTAA